jgi:hypothetical protein
MDAGAVETGIAPPAGIIQHVDEFLSSQLRKMAQAFTINSLFPELGGSLLRLSEFA